MAIVTIPKGPDAFRRAQMELFTLNQIQDYVVRDLKLSLDTTVKQSYKTLIYQPLITFVLSTENGILGLIFGTINFL